MKKKKRKRSDQDKCLEERNTPAACCCCCCRCCCCWLLELLLQSLACPTFAGVNALQSGLLSLLSYWMLSLSLALVVLLLIFCLFHSLIFLASLCILLTLQQAPVHRRQEYLRWCNAASAQHVTMFTCEERGERGRRRIM